MDEEVRRLASRGEESRNVARVKQGDYMVEDNVVQTVTVKTERTHLKSSNYKCANVTKLSMFLQHCEIKEMLNI